MSYPATSIRPKVAELALTVFGKPLHPELYVVHASRRIEREHYTTDVQITACGHVVTFQTAIGTMCEVAASTHQPLPTLRRRYASRLKGRRTDTVVDDRGMKYRVSHQLETVEVDLFWMMQKQLDQGDNAGLVHRFDSSGRISMGALSYINVETRLRSMLVQAVHTFPDDHAVLKIESLFSIPAKVREPSSVAAGD